MIMVSTRIHLAGVFCLIFLAGCVSTPPSEAERDLRFNHLGPQILDVSSLAIVQAYKAPFTEPHVDHEMTPSPMSALLHWADDRLKARGGTVTAQFVIDDARVTRTELKTDKGFTGLFKEEQAARFDIRLAGRFIVFDQGGQIIGVATGQVDRFQTAPEGLTLNERDDLLFRLLEAAMQDFDKQMIAAMRKHTGSWVR